MKSLLILLTVLILVVMIAVGPCAAQAPQAGASQSSESAPEVTYHVTIMLPQYRFVDTSGYGGRVGEYDTLQQSLGGDLSLNFADLPEHLSIKSSTSVISRDDYESKSSLILGKWLDVGLENRSFVRHLDDNTYFGASVISPDIIRIDSIPPDSLLGIRRRMNKANVRIQLPKIPVRLFVKGGWQARDGNSQMQYFDMGGSGDPVVDQGGCANCHSASQFRPYNYTTRNIAGGAEITLARLLKLTYQHEFRSFNDRLQNPRDLYGTSGEIPPVEDIPFNPAGSYVHSVLPRHQTQSDSLQVSMAVAHHLTFSSDVSYARTTDLFTNHPQNAFNADATLTWNPVSRLRAVVDFHQQNLLNDFAQTFSLSDPAIIYPFGNPSLHRHWTGLKLSYRATRQLDLATYYKRMNITRSNAALWPQISSPDNYDPLFVVPSSSSNIAGLVLRFHTDRLWNARAGYEWTGTHDPGYVTDPGTNHRIFGDVTISPVQWLSFSNDGSILLQQSFPAVQRSNHLYVDSTFVTIKPVPQWNIGAGYTYMQDNLRTDMRLMNDAGIGTYTQPLVPYKELSQSFSLHTSYELKKRLAFQVDFARSVAHSAFRPDLNPADYPAFNYANAVMVDGNPYPSLAAYTTAFSQALGVAAGPVSLMDVPQSIVGSTLNYHAQSGFDGGLRFNYGSYADRVRPDLSGQVRSYTAFFGRVW